VACDKRLGKGFRSKGVCVLAVTGCRRVDKVRGHKVFSIPLHALFQFIEGAPAVVKDQVHIAQHVRVERHDAREKKGDTSFWAEGLTEIVGAALIADASGFVAEFFVCQRDAFAEIGERGGHKRDDQGLFERPARAGIGEILQGEPCGVFREILDAGQLFDQCGFMISANEEEFRFEEVTEVVAAHASPPAYSSRMVMPQLPVKSTAETPARRKCSRLPRIQGRASSSRYKGDFAEESRG